MKDKKLEYLTFKQFVYTINIRQYYNEKEDACPIRIYLDTISWIDLAWYDWCNKDTCWEFLEKILNKDILNSYVTSMGFIEDNNQIYIWLDPNPTETLKEFAN